MNARDAFPNRRDLFAATAACTCSAFIDAQDARAQETPRDVFVERPAAGTPHKGKVLLAVQAHSDDIPLMAGGGSPSSSRRGTPATSCGRRTTTWATPPA